MAKVCEQERCSHGYCQRSIHVSCYCQRATLPHPNLLSLSTTTSSPQIILKESPPPQPMLFKALTAITYQGLYNSFQHLYSKLPLTVDSNGFYT
jgi:hypothetical protein